MTPAAALKKLMQRPPVLSVACAESVTGGNVQALLTSVSGASDYFLGGITAYSLDEKVRCLGVNRAHARRANSVSQQVAVEMAVGACRLFDADLSVATTGYAEPARAHGIKVPMAWWAIHHRLGGGSAVVISGCVEVTGEDRVGVQLRVAETVLAELVAYVRELHGARKKKARRKKAPKKTAAKKRAPKRR
ncbi:MAG: CinA family protein [Candidatus Didemnitutus sp.]|nr:CinA family protein [Candidatus Didemnitutus sp.]